MKLYWRMKKYGKWTWKPLQGNWLTSKEIVEDLLFYNKVIDPRKEEE